VKEKLACKEGAQEGCAGGRVRRKGAQEGCVGRVRSKERVQSVSGEWHRVGKKI
jgi:hypothetical protein